MRFVSGLPPDLIHPAFAGLRRISSTESARQRLPELVGTPRLFSRVEIAFAPMRAQPSPVYQL